jgi:hypothetical protein
MCLSDGFARRSYAEQGRSSSSILRFVVHTKIAGQPALVVRPHRRDQVDSLNHPAVLIRPMPRHQRHLGRIRLIQCLVIDDEHASVSLNQQLHFLPLGSRYRVANASGTARRRHALALVPPVDGFARLQHCQIPAALQSES